MSNPTGSTAPEGAARRQERGEESLQPRTARWLEELPREARPQRLAAQYARIANQIAREWSETPRCIALLNELLTDRRGVRAGFPTEIALELATLKNYYETVLHPTPQTVWDELASRSRK